MSFTKNELNFQAQVLEMLFPGANQENIEIIAEQILSDNPNPKFPKSITKQNTFASKANKTGSNN